VAQIDRLVELLFRRRADAVVIAPDAAAVLVAGGERRAVTPRAVAAKTAEALLAEIAPPALAEDLLSEGEHRFEHPSPHGTVRVLVRRSRRALRIELAPAQAPARVEATPAAEDPADARAANDAPAGRGGVDRLLHRMVREGCSDLHLASGCPPLFRKDGGMTSLGEGEPIAPETLLEMLHAITPPDRRSEFEERHDSDFSYEIPGLARFRCNLFVDRRGAGAVFRVIPAEVPSAKTLGIPEAILSLCELKKGLVVVTGPTGSGKSTTLAALVDHVNRTRDAHIITIEDPIEFVHENRRCLVNQREIGSHTRGFKSALRAALREDPDIVLVGEMRDLETVEIAIETAETGHLVFGTLHTNTAASTVDRIIDQFPADRQGQIRTMLAGSLKGVVAQTLCRKKGGGRCAALEVLVVTAAVSNLIREGKTFQIPSLMQTGRKLGMQRLSDALLELVLADRVEPEEAYAHAAHRDELAKLLQARGVPLRVAEELAEGGSS